MKPLGTLVAWLLVLAPVAAQGAELRLRLENSGQDGRVRIVRSDEVVRTVEISMPGLVSGEMVTVEAPAERVRLKGGSIGGDLLLEALVEQKSGETSARAPTVLVLPAPPRFPLEPRQYPNQMFTDVGFAYWWPELGAWPVRGVEGSWRDRGHTEHRPRRPSYAPSPRGGYSTRAMLPRR